MEVMGTTCHLEPEMKTEDRFQTNLARLRWLTLTDHQLVPWLDASSFVSRPLLSDSLTSLCHAIGDKRHPDGSINYDYLDAGRWWEAGAGVLSQGWVRNERFGAGVVIPGTNRSAQRKAKTR